MKFLRFTFGFLGLILANLLPLYGILFWGWRATELLFCFWVENVVVGIFTMLKIAKYRDFFLLSFFPMHYGIFMLVHFIFLVVGASIGFFGVEQVTDVWPLLGGIGAFFVGALGSHALSYYTNFLQGREWEKHSTFYYFILPYGRIVPMHLTIILGAVFGAGPFILYSMKLAIDVMGYVVEHGLVHFKQQNRSAQTPHAPAAQL